MKHSIVYSITMKICSVIREYYDNSILAKIIKNIVKGISISYETSYISKVIKDKKDIFEQSITRKFVEFILKVINILLSSVNKIFSNTKYSKSSEVVYDLSIIDKLLPVCGKFFLAYGLVSVLISIYAGNIIMTVIMLFLAIIGLVFVSKRSMKYFRGSIIYRILTYFISFRSKEWN